MAEDDGEVDTDFPGTHILHICYSTTKPFQDLGFSVCVFISPIFVVL